MKIAVVGGGASGLLCSGLLGKKGHYVTLFEKNKILGKKILVTGNGRCNITNFTNDIDEFLRNIPRNPKFLYPAFTSFTPEKTVNFFNNLGVKTKVESNNKVFPVSDKSLDVVDTLYDFCKNNNVQFKLDERVLDVNDVTSSSNLQIVTTRNTYNFDKVIIATGGMSYPNTGSTGDGYNMAESFGHKIIPPEASLVGLVSSDENIKKIMGISLTDVKIRLFNEKKEVFTDTGDMIFTHFGISGPLVFRCSSFMKSKEKYRIYIDFSKEKSIDELTSNIIKIFENNKNKDIDNILNEFVPKKIIPLLLEKSDINKQTKVNIITKKQRENLCKNIKNFEIPISKKRPLEEATITRGGVSVKEINPKTMASKKNENLYFIGEVLDVDGLTGGFNLQIAWSTAYITSFIELDT